MRRPSKDEMATITGAAVTVLILLLLTLCAFYYQPTKQQAKRKAPLPHYTIDCPPEGLFIFFPGGNNSWFSDNEVHVAKEGQKTWFKTKQGTVFIVGECSIQSVNEQ